MKKFTLIACAMCFALSGVKAQETTENNNNGNTTPSTQVASEKTEFQGTDLGINIDTDADVYGVSFGGDQDKHGYMTFGMKMGFGDVSIYSFTFGYGLKKRYVMNDSFLIQGMIYPYAGYSLMSYEVVSYTDKGYKKTETKDDSEFAWGAAANLSIGLKLWNTKKGNSTFLTLGYYISAPELETKNLIDNGSWGIGFTTILK